MFNILDAKIIETVLKVIYMAAAFFYLIYSLIMFRQVQLMKKTLITGISSSVGLLSIVNLLIALTVFVGFLLFL